MSKPIVSKSTRTTISMSIVTVKEIPLLSDEERAELLKSLEDAQADIAAGCFTELEARRSRRLVPPNRAQGTIAQYIIFD